MPPRRTARRAPRRRLVAALALVPLACSSGASPATSASSGCQAPFEEDLDPAHLVHLIDPDGGTFLTDPPTSGPHWVGPLPEGELDRPLPPAVQVSILEQGRVLVQHRDLAPAELEALRPLTGPDVVLAPNGTLPERVVATAWTVKKVCEAPDTEALARFVDDHAGQVAGHAGHDEQP